jgi:hypothetical protein
LIFGKLGNNKRPVDSEMRELIWQNCAVDGVYVSENHGHRPLFSCDKTRCGDTCAVFVLDLINKVHEVFPRAVGDLWSEKLVHEMHRAHFRAQNVVMLAAQELCDVHRLIAGHKTHIGGHGKHASYTRDRRLC